MDLEAFLELERERLQKDRAQIEKVKQELLTNRKTETTEKVGHAYVIQESPAGITQNENAPADSTNSKSFAGEEENSEMHAAPTKLATEWVNNEYFITNQNSDEQKENQISKKRDQDDMEQWVTDTFYSYFPGFNNESEKRQNYLRERQRENQENFIKHQMMQKVHNEAGAQKSSTVLSQSPSPNKAHTADKTDLEIIVNNPNYVPLKHSGAARPGSTRHKLLQDLKHTALSANGPGEIGGSLLSIRRKHEHEMQRKKDYQRELMQQIEEKRQAIELLRQKEQEEDEALTRRLQQQLKTIELQEQYEKEKMRAERVRFDVEQKRLIREHLVNKLDNDSKLLFGKQNTRRTENTRLDEKSTVPTTSEDANKVYKYFSNSARHEFRRGKPLPTDMDLNLQIHDNLQLNTNELECFHLSDKVCPMCDAPLKSYENCCLRCQKQLSLKFGGDSRPQPDHHTGTDLGSAEPSDQSDPQIDCDAHPYALVCVKCERLYTLCPTCLAKNDVCRACNRKINVCMSCRRRLCTFCLEEIALGRDTERSHINERDGNQQGPNSKSSAPVPGVVETSSVRSFQVLETSYGNVGEGESEVESVYRTPDGQRVSPPFRHIRNNLRPSGGPPYSINNKSDTLFQPETGTRHSNAINSFDQLPKFTDKNLSLDLDMSRSEEEQKKTIERVRRETDKRLSAYVKNYGDLARGKRSLSESRNRSTQTSPETAGRRDIVLTGDHNLSMPLLREMPKMTRAESKAAFGGCNEKHTKIDHLKRRWEVPAVQKISISSTSPQVLTQVGAIRKQLQAECLALDSNRPDHKGSYC